MRILSIVRAATVLFVTSLALSCQADIPRPEHPRPDCQREAWLNLNGEWQFEIDAKLEGERSGWISGRDLAQRIVVPFCPESKLSGLGLATNYLPHVWYRRQFQVPAAWRGQRLLLHFGAVDYTARVWLNGQFLGEHAAATLRLRLKSPTAYATATTSWWSMSWTNFVPACSRAANRATARARAASIRAPRASGRPCGWRRWGRRISSEFTLTPDLDGGRIFCKAAVTARPRA